MSVIGVGIFLYIYFAAMYAAATQGGTLGAVVAVIMLLIPIAIAIAALVDSKKLPQDPRKVHGKIPWGGHVAIRNEIWRDWKSGERKFYPKEYVEYLKRNLSAQARYENDLINLALYRAGEDPFVYDTYMGAMYRFNPATYEQDWDMLFKKAHLSTIEYYNATGEYHDSPATIPDLTYKASDYLLPQDSNIKEGMTMDGGTENNRR